MKLPGGKFDIKLKKAYTVLLSPLAKNDNLHEKISAIAQAAFSFHQNHELIRAKIKVPSLSEEKRLLLIAELVGEEERQKPGSKVKGKEISKPQVHKRPDIPNASSSSSALPPSDPIPDPTPIKFLYHKRIKRWATKDPAIIRAFKDKVNGADVYHYALMNDDQIMDQRKVHFFPKIEERVLSSENKDVYYTETERGFRMVGLLKKSANILDFKYGEVLLGYDKVHHIVFHKQFVEWRGDRGDHEQFFKKAELPQVDEDQSETWDIVGGTTWKVDPQTREIEFTFAGESHSLVIYPLD